ncbi:MAG: EAL domain-containing protein [Lachnospiraceae bacterium]|nr:EAL domain-containing protein [Lachnospiraceae bacterium]
MHEMSESENLKSYIVENFQLALDEGWIEAYYQPVIRTMTRKLCGFEALARWNDPDKGLLSPCVFIPVLEEHRLIQKLDCRILELVCRAYKEARAQNDPFVPVSFNLSRLDFNLRDIPAFIEKTVIAAGMPRELVNIEITESAVASDPDFMKQQVERIRSMGYQVWMDDFGSEYSSLNILKDFEFDELKIDMKFLSDSGRKSREIITAIVDMAKHIDMQTLAEGVETAEQASFLSNVGCEKLQGYFFGKPMPLEECLNTLEDQGIEMEPVGMRKYYDDLGAINFLDGSMISGITEAKDGLERSGVPFCILEMKGEDIDFLLTNESFRKEMRTIGIANLEETKARIRRDSSLAAQLRAIMNKARTSGEEEHLDMSYAGHFCTARMRCVATWKDGCALLASFRNLSNNPTMLKRQRLNEALQVFYTIYDRVDLIDIDQDNIQTLYNKNHIISSIEKDSFVETVNALADNFVYFEDRQRYREFADVKTVRKRLRNSENGYLSFRYRLRNLEGRFIWVVQIVVGMPSMGGNLILSLVRSTAVAGDADINNGTGMEQEISDIDSETLWQNLVLNADIGLFWKDKNRRFLGANQTFLDYYGIRDIRELVGKTDEEMGWHVDPGPFLEDELKILKNGEATSAVPGKCICKGSERDILASKMPLYRNGEISGLIGYFVDVTNQTSKAEHVEMMSYVDSMTELLNMRGLLEESIRYTEGFLFRKKDYALIYLDICRFRQYNEDYGREWANHLLIRVGDVIRQTLGVTGIAARTGGDQFAILRQFDKEEEVRELEQRLIRAILDIGTVDNMPCTPYVSSAYVIYSEGSGLEQMYAQAKEKVRNKKNKPKTS